MAQQPVTDSAAQQAMSSPLEGVMRREPIACAPGTPIRTAIEEMRAHRIGSMVVVDGNLAPIGIFTLRDLLDRVALSGDALDQPISTVMSSDVFALSSRATVYEATLAMLRRGIRHVLVVEGGKLAGLVSEKDLFSLQRISMRQLAGAIHDARDIEHLVRFSEEIRQHARKMLEQGMAAEPLTQFIASLNDLLTQRLIDLVFADLGSDGIRFCWIALGSEGRYEQTFFTDQDNGIVFAAGGDIEAARNRLLPYAQRVNEILGRCGFPLCKGDIMAGNQRWCLSLDEWRHRFANWIDSGEPQALLHGAIFFDFRALHGDVGLADSLREWLLQHAAKTPRFLHQMAENALRNRSPLGLLRDFVTSDDPGHPGTIDLKLNGAMLFVDAARVYSLAAGVAQTNTCERLRQFAALSKVPRLEMQAWVDAFLLIQLLRLRQQQQRSLRGLPLDNRVNPDHLNAMERQTLKEALRQARALQSRLAADYRL
jgi:CBS domain-containing protein